eukprot:TRINITY_DN2702_c0_g1_i2.p1 TRINITY_DN2702_c0_g1~~TRINITY_DN2702_c0_g1_i2.p1  ORF type:complete len:349 (+),score=87.44 TRINITY_DN2702_c0_g1_i2:94-1140(+)
MFDVLQEVLSGTLFDDVERVNVLVNQTASYAASSVTDSGHTYARSLAASVLTKAAYVQERFSGITQVQFLTQLAAKDVDAETAEKFKAISRHLRQNLVRVGAVAEASAMTQASSFMNNFSKSVISTKNNNSSSQWREREPVELPQISERKGRFVQLPAQVNFVSRVIDTHLPFTNEDTARLTVLGKVMSNGFLHREIREKGGAYGGGAAFGSGTFDFYSYRDPRGLATLNTFTESVQWIQQPDAFGQRELDEAKLGLFQSIDAPKAPADMGMRMFVSGITNEQRAQYRQQVLDVTAADVRRVAQRYLEESRRDNAIQAKAEAVFGGNPSEFKEDVWEHWNMDAAEGAQ